MLVYEFFLQVFINSLAGVRQIMIRVSWGQGQGQNAHVYPLATCMYVLPAWWTNIQQSSVLSHSMLHTLCWHTFTALILTNCGSC